MHELDGLAARFEASRPRLRAVAYRMLGSISEADDAVQEAWLHLSRSDPGAVDNLGGWLTTVTARVCLDMLRARRSRREQPLDSVPEPAAVGPGASVDPWASPENEALLADSVGLAMLVVLDTLAPAERVAFVLHDMFDLPFGQIADITGRSPAAARQLASRARRRVKGTAATPGTERARQRKVVEAFLAASRGGDFEALLAVLDPDVELRADPVAVPAGLQRHLRGATVVASQGLAFSRRARDGRLALVNGSVGLILAPRGRLLLALSLTIADDRITEIDVVADRERLSQLDLAVLDLGGSGWRAAGLLSGDVLQADLAVGDQPARLIADIDAPQLLGTPLAQGGGLDVHPAVGDRPQEVGGVGQPDRDLALVPHGGARADAGRALDGGRVDAPVDDAPRRVMIRAEHQVAGNPGRRDFVEDEAGRAQERAALFEGGRLQARTAPGGDRAALSVHRRSLRSSRPGGDPPR